MLPFTRDQFLTVFVDYNTAIWPSQIVAYLLGAVAVGILFRPSPLATRLTAAILALMWLWTGLAYHVAFFAAINTAAYAFGALFVIEAVAIGSAGLAGGKLAFGFRSDASGWVGLGLVAYAAVAYPLIGIGLGHAYPAMPMFGVTPCPVTIFTFGMFLLTRGRPPWWLLVIPFVWSLIGGSAAILLDVPQDWVLLASGLISVPLLIVRDRRRRA